MLIDINAHLGAYPFRQIRHKTVEGLLGLMRRSGIDHAVVSANTSLLYRDVHRGNDEVRQALGAAGGKLSGIATINPRYSSWKRDMAEAVEQWGFKAVRLLPQYHDYDLADADGQAALEAIAELGVPVAFHERVEDHRQMHPWDRARPMSFAAVGKALAKFTDMKVLWLNGLGINADLVRDAGLEGRILIDINRFDVTLMQTLEKFIDALGADSFAFGTHMPMSYVGPALVRMEVLRLSDDDKQKLAWRNASQYLNLNVGETVAAS
jgi:predicted TIM-barrel fold metal-dependent hydrolase